MHLLEIHVIISSYLTPVCMHSELDVMMCAVGSDLRRRGCGDRLCGGRQCVEASLRELLVFLLLNCCDFMLILRAVFSFLSGIILRIWTESV